MPVSADTFSVEVARRALAAGAVAVNDISGGSEEMFELVAESGLRLRADAHRGAAAGRPARRRVRRRRRPPAGLVRGESRAWLGTLGSARSRSRSTPDSTSTSATEQDLEILRRLGELRALGLPLYVSLSRKDFIGAVLAGSWEERLPAARARVGDGRRGRARRARAAPTSSASTTAARCRRCGSPAAIARPAGSAA